MTTTDIARLQRIEEAARIVCRTHDIRHDSAAVGFAIHDLSAALAATEPADGEDEANRRWLVDVANRIVVNGGYFYLTSDDVARLREIAELLRDRSQIYISPTEHEQLRELLVERDKEIARLREAGQSWHPKYHRCKGKLRQWPSIFCSMHQGLPAEGLDFDPAEEIGRLEQENARLRAAIDPILKHAVQVPPDNFPSPIYRRISEHDFQVLREALYPATPAEGATK